MKIINASIVLIVFGLASSCNNGSQKECNKNHCDDQNNKDKSEYSLIKKSKVTFAPIANEDTLYLEISTVDPDDAEEEINLSRKNIQLHGDSLKRLLAEIDTLALDQLQREAASIPGSGRQLTGIKIIFSSNNNISAFYQPVKFINTNYTYGQGAQHFGHYSIRVHADTFLYSGGAAFTAVPVAEKERMRDSIRSYKKVKIKRKNAANFGNFVDKDNYTGDVTCLFFTFQEINSLRKANKHQKYVRFWNVLHEIEVAEDIKLHKHGIFLSSEHVPEATGDIRIPTFAGKLANLSHMCPPSCNSGFSFRLVN